ncbi:MAG: cation diffusion facilitator family transporter [Eubacteriales bacterium]|nr:cation diffusion facilitator family transporter [Eubacteriales bacterium]
MTNILLKTFVKNHRNTDDSQVRAAVGTLSGAVGIGCNVLLFLGKLLVGTLSDSVSITADAMNNLSDASGSIVTLIGFKLADKPADADHPFGHARFEYLSGLAVAVMILLIGLELAKTSVEKIISPTPVAMSLVTAAVLVGSIAVKLWMAAFNRRLGGLIQSTTLLATAADSRNDCIATAAVLAAALIEHFAGLRVDGWFGLAVAVFILYSGWSLAKDTISPLLGENANPELQRDLVDYISRQPKVLGYHDLMVHDYGPGQRFASLHVEMDRNEDPLDCHELIDDMERECLRSHNVHLVIHYDPVITDDPELTRLKQAVIGLLKARDPRLSLHDFRMVPGKRHMNLVFDVALPADLKGQEASIRDMISDALNTGGEITYHIVITYDAAAFN